MSVMKGVTIHKTQGDGWHAALRLKELPSAPTEEFSVAFHKLVAQYHNTPKGKIFSVLNIYIASMAEEE